MSVRMDRATLAHLRCYLNSGVANLDNPRTTLHFICCRLVCFLLFNVITQIFIVKSSVN